MRIMLVSQRLPYLPCHDAFRVLPSHVLQHLSGRHAIGVVAPLSAGQTPAPRAWTAGRAAWLELVPAGRRRRALAGTPAEAVAVERRYTWRTVAERYEHLYGRLAAGNRTRRHTREVAA